MDYISPIRMVGLTFLTVSRRDWPSRPGQEESWQEGGAEGHEEHEEHEHEEREHEEHDHEKHNNKHKKIEHE